MAMPPAILVPAMKNLGILPPRFQNFVTVIITQFEHFCNRAHRMFCGDMMTDREIQQKLKNFDSVWQRVQQAKPLSGSARLMPRKDLKSRATRFDPRAR
jgi:hypothetical protein